MISLRSSDGSIMWQVSRRFWTASFDLSKILFLEAEQLQTIIKKFNCKIHVSRPNELSIKGQLLSHVVKPPLT